jgi:hypothetical protein
MLAFDMDACDLACVVFICCLYALALGGAVVLHGQISRVAQRWRDRQ